MSTSRAPHTNSGATGASPVLGELGGRAGTPGSPQTSLQSKISRWAQPMAVAAELRRVAEIAAPEGIPGLEGWGQDAAARQDSDIETQKNVSRTRGRIRWPARSLERSGKSAGGTA